MRCRRLAVLIGSLLLSGCDRSAPSASAPSSSSVRALVRSPFPLKGMRVSAGTPTPGLGSSFQSSKDHPSLILKLEYEGSKSWLDVETEFWSKGKRFEGGEGGQSIYAPLSDVAAFGFSEGLDKEGRPRVIVTESIPAMSKGPGGGGSARMGSTKDYHDVPSLKNRRILTFHPQWPIEIVDGKEAVVWAVFVDEPPGSPETDSLEERAARADAAWIFRIGPGDEKK